MVKQENTSTCKQVNISLIDSQTGNAQKIGIVTTPVSISWRDEHIPPIDIKTSFQFQCKLNAEEYDDFESGLYQETWQWRQAIRLSEELNDLIEEYHAPGNPRNERRTINRQFDRTFRIFLKHCQKWHIDYTFKKQDNEIRP